MHEMHTIPEVLKSGYFFDLDRMDYIELFDGISGVWNVVKNLQEGTVAKKIVLDKCKAVNDSEVKRPVVSGFAEVHVAGTAKFGPNVVISGKGGLLCVDEGAEILAGTMIATGRNFVYIGRGARIGPNAYLDASKGGICVGEAAELRQGAYIRESALIGRKAVIGSSCEIKCSVIGPEAEVPHFNYVGDSVFGYKAHTGAGVKVSNLKIAPDPEKKDTIKIRHAGMVYDTGMRKFGAVLGDYAQLGCNAVTNPGSLIGKHSLIYAGSNISGFLPENTVFKLRQTFERTSIIHERS